MEQIVSTTSAPAGLKTMTGIFSEHGNEKSAKTFLKKYEKMQYDYLVIGNSHVNNVTAHSGIEGKLNNSLGQYMELYFIDNEICGLKDQSGKVYINKPDWHMIIALIMLATGILVSLTIIGAIIGIPFVLMGGEMLREVTNDNKMKTAFPNAIQLQK